ncbi:MAG TPA: hypothetical protein VEY12_09185 [Thermoplasmata archaeon]|nr:hypothetical protein [Thermoplasmata archaeon]
MERDDYAQLAGKLVRITLNRGLDKRRMGVFLGADAQTIRVSELYSRGHFLVRTIPRSEIARIQTIDLNTGNWAED